MAQELYELPEGWKWEDLSSVAEMSRRSLQPQKDTEYNYIGLEHIEGGTGHLLDYSATQGDSISSTKIEFSKGMVLYGKLRPYLNKVHVAQFDGIATTEIIPFKCFDGTYSEYLAAYMRSGHFLDAVMSNCSGARMPRATTKFFKNIAKIPLPPLNEQKRIVAKLDALFTRIDTAITHLKQTLELSKALFASALDGAVRPKEIPSNWIKGKFGEFASFSQGLQVPVGDQIHNFSEGLVQFLRISDFVRDDEPARYIQDPGDRYKVKEQDLSMIRYGDAGKVVRGFSGAIANNLFRINTTDVFNVDFLYYLLSSPSVYSFLRAGNTSSTMPAISFKVVKNIPVVIPPKDEQKKFVTHLDTLSERTHTLEVTTQEKINDLTTLKASLLDAAFKGEL